MFSGEIKINQGSFMSSFPIIIVMIIQYHKTGEVSKILLKLEAIRKILLSKSQISKNSKNNFTLVSNNRAFK
jgi:hypothetical protein